MSMGVGVCIWGMLVSTVLKRLVVTGEYRGKGVRSDAAVGELAGGLAKGLLGGLEELDLSGILTDSKTVVARLARALQLCGGMPKLRALSLPELPKGGDMMLVTFLDAITRPRFPRLRYLGSTSLSFDDLAGRFNRKEGMAWTQCVWWDWE